MIIVCVFVYIKKARKRVYPFILVPFCNKTSFLNRFNNYLLSVLSFMNRDRLMS